MYLEEIADEIHRDLGSPSTLSQGLIRLWLREHIGDLNNLLNANYAINLADHTITPQLGEKEKSIYKYLYSLYYYDKSIRDNLGASSYNTVTSVTSDGATVRLTNKTDTARTYIQLRKEVSVELKHLINNYNKNISPKQVVGDDTVSAVSPTEGGEF